MDTFIKIRRTVININTIKYILSLREVDDKSGIQFTVVFKNHEDTLRFVFNFDNYDGKHKKELTEKVKEELGRLQDYLLCYNDSESQNTNKYFF